MCACHRKLVARWTTKLHSTTTNGVTHRLPPRVRGLDVERPVSVPDSVLCTELASFYLPMLMRDTKFAVSLSFSLCVSVSVCLSVCGASPPKLPNGFGWNVAHGWRPVSHFDGDRPSTPPGNPKMFHWEILCQYCTDQLVLWTSFIATRFKFSLVFQLTTSVLLSGGPRPSKDSNLPQYGGRPWPWREGSEFRTDRGKETGNGISSIERKQVANFKISKI